MEVDSPSEEDAGMSEKFEQLTSEEHQLYVVPGTEGTDIPKALDSDAFNVAHLSTSGEFATIRGVRLADKPLDAAGPGFLWERPEVRPDEAPTKPTKAIITRRADPWPDPVEPEKKPDEVATIRDSRTVDATPENLEKLRSDMEAKKAESPDTETLIEVDATLNLKTLAEVDRMLGEGMTVKEISAELEKNGRPVPWTKIRARAAHLAKMKRKEAKPESQEVGATDARPEPVSISRKELDLRIWDMWRAGKTLEEISEILYSEGLYYSAKSVRVRLLSQGAKL